MHEKFPLGPMVEPKPGPTLKPMLLLQKSVIKSRPVIDNNTVVQKKMTSTCI